MGCPPVLKGSRGPHLPPARECLFTHFLKELDLHGCNETGHTVAEFEQRQLELPVLIEAVTLSAQPLEWSYLRITPIPRRRLKEACPGLLEKREFSAMRTPSERQPRCAPGAVHLKSNAI